MANYDGDVTIGVDLTIDQAVARAEVLKEEITELLNNTSGDQTSKEFDKLQSKATTLAAKLDKTLGKLEAVQNVQVPTEQYSRLEAQLKELETSWMNLFNNYKDYGVGQGKLAIGVLDLTQKKIDETKAKMQELVDSGRAFTIGQGNAEKIESLRRELISLSDEAIKTTDALYGIGNVETPEEPINWTYRLGQGLGHILRLSADLPKNFLKLSSSALVNGIKRLGKSLSQLSKHTRSNNNALAIGFKKFVQFGLGIRTVFLLVKKLRQALIDGFGNIAQYSSEFNGLVSAFVSALATLKNSFATAFAPIATVALPLLTALMNALVRVMNIIGQFFAAITGKGTFIQAKAVQKDYAASLKKTGSSGGSAAKGLGKAKDAAEDLKKTIAGFDDVEILHEDKDSDSSSGSGGGGGGGAGLGDLDPANMFETVEVESPIKDLANRLREAIASQNWEELGSILAEGINGIFTKANELISWDNIGEKITFIITAITTTFNSMVDNINWELIGLTIANGINTLVNTVYLLVSGIDWGNLGKSLITGLNSLINNINWKTLGRTVYESFIGVLDFLRAALREFDWYGIGKAFGNFLAGINWLDLVANVIDIFAELGITLYTGILQVILGALKDVIGDIAVWITGDEGAREIVDGFFDGISNALSDVRTWVQTHIFDPFINAFKSVFEISSPSKVMERMGGYIIDGLKNGLTNTWKNIKEFFTGKTDEITKNFKKANWKSAGNGAVTALKDGVKNKWSEVVTAVGSGSDEAADKITKTDWRSKGTTVSSEVQTGIVNRWSQITTFINTSVANLGRIITNFNWSNVGSTISNTIKSGLSSAWSSITSFVNNNVGSIKNAFNNTNWKSVGENICKGIKKGMDNTSYLVEDTAQNIASNALDYMKSKLKINSPSKVFRDVIGKAIPEGIAVGIDEGASMALDSVQNLADSLTDTQLPELEMPPIAMGEIIPYETSKTMENLTSSIKNLMDVLQYQQSNAITRDELISVLNSVLPSMLQQYISFYIGDEEVARHANLGNEMLAQRFNPVGI